MVLLTFHQSGKLLLLRVRQTHYALVFGALLGNWARLRQPQFTRLVEGQYDHHEFDLLGPVCQQTRLFRAVNNDWWAFPAATWQPIPLEKRHWYSQRFRREMRQRWELIQRSAAPQSQIAEDR